MNIVIGVHHFVRTALAVGPIGMLPVTIAAGVVADATFAWAFRLLDRETVLPVAGNTRRQLQRHAA